MVSTQSPFSFCNNDNQPTIAEKHWNDIEHYLSSFKWRWVVVLTVADIPGRSVPRFSTKKLIDEMYPRFLKRVRDQLTVDVEDFWIVEYGSVNGRQHLNVLLSANTVCDAALLKTIWSEVAGSHAWVDRYDPCRGVSYWVKHFRADDTRKLLYGGSVTCGNIEEPVQRGPGRKRKRDYRQPLRYRQIGVRYG